MLKINRIKETKMEFCMKTNIAILATSLLTLCSLTHAAAGPPETWYWRNPLPQGDRLASVVLWRWPLRRRLVSRPRDPFPKRTGLDAGKAGGGCLFPPRVLWQRPVCPGKTPPIDRNIARWRNVDAAEFGHHQSPECRRLWQRPLRRGRRRKYESRQRHSDVAGRYHLDAAECGHKPPALGRHLCQRTFCRRRREFRRRRNPDFTRRRHVDAAKFTGVDFGRFR